ncbi:MAG TPA: hypothetical protein VIY73_03080, partial [Polyangiaceae bacterium]
MDRREDPHSWTRAGLAAVVAAAVASVVGAPQWNTTACDTGVLLRDFASSFALASVLAVVLVCARVRTWTGVFLLGAAACAFQAAFLLVPIVRDHAPVAAFGVRAAYGAVRALACAAVLGSFELFTLDGRPRGAGEHSGGDTTR